MKIFKTTQHNIIRIAVTIMVYLTIWITGTSIYFGGFTALLNKINNYGGSTTQQLIIATLILAPYFVIQYLINPKITITVEDERLRITQKGQSEKIILFQDIHSMHVNVESMNTLCIRNRHNHALYTLTSKTNENNLIENIPNAIAEKSDFKKQSISKKYLNKTYHTITYSKEN